MNGTLLTVDPLDREEGVWNRFSCSSDYSEVYKQLNQLQVFPEDIIMTILAYYPMEFSVACSAVAQHERREGEWYSCGATTCFTIGNVKNGIIPIIEADQDFYDKFTVGVNSKSVLSIQCSHSGYFWMHRASPTPTPSAQYEPYGMFDSQDDTPSFSEEDQFDQYHGEEMN